MTTADPNQLVACYARVDFSRTEKVRSVASALLVTKAAFLCRPLREGHVMTTADPDRWPATCTATARRHGDGPRIRAAVDADGITVEDFAREARHD